jgi:hypothetical protein
MCESYKLLVTSLLPLRLLLLLLLLLPPRQAS